MKKRRPAPLTEFDPAKYLDSEKMIAEYLSQVFEAGDPEEIRVAVGNVARARGFAGIASATGLGRESLYKTFAPGTKPRWDTMMRIVSALGVRLAVKGR